MLTKAYYIDLKRSLEPQISAMHNHMHEVQYVIINRVNINSRINSPLCDPFFKKIIINRKCCAKYVFSCTFTFGDASHGQMV